VAKQRRKKQDSPLWQWLLVAAVAFGLYKGIDYYLNLQPAHPPTAVKSPAPAKAIPTPAPETQATPITAWTFESAKKFLPEQAYPDNFRPVPLEKNQGALLAFAKKIPGKDPGPQGLTNTQPGLQFIHWDGKQYQSQEIEFTKLAPALGDIPLHQLEGLPQFNQLPFKEGDVTLYPMRLFLHQDNREIVAFLEAQGPSVQWAELKNPIGKRMPALFVLGTTATDSRKFRQQKVGGRNYLILEIGTMDELKAYEGYQWQVQAYYWDGQEYVYDADFSKKLTEAKKNST
jgi:hypothetical protein